MPVVAVGAAVVGAVSAVVGTVNSVVQGKKANKAAKKAARAERQKGDLQAMREKIAALKEGRSAYAQALQNAENQGVSGSSSAQGGQGSIISQRNANLSFLDQYGYLSDMAYKYGRDAADAQAKQGMWDAVAGFGMQLYSASGGFSGPKPPKSG